MARKTIQVEMLTTVAGIGKQGEVKNVSLAQARNQLLPKGLVKLYEENQNTKPEMSDLSGKELANTLHAQTLIIPHEIHGEKIIGHFDGKNVVEEIKRIFHIRLDGSCIKFDTVKHPKKAGKYDFLVSHPDNTYIKMHLEITKK